MPAQPSLSRSSLLETFRGRESQTTLPRNVLSGEERGRDSCIRRLPFLAFLAIFRAPSLQYRCYFVVFNRRAKARTKRARSAEHARRGRVRCQLFISAPSPFTSVPRSSLAWRFSLLAWKTRKLTPVLQAIMCPDECKGSKGTVLTNSWFMLQRFLQRRSCKKECEWGCRNDSDCCLYKNTGRNGRCRSYNNWPQG